MSWVTMVLHTWLDPDWKSLVPSGYEDVFLTDDVGFNPVEERIGRYLDVDNWAHTVLALFRDGLVIVCRRFMDRIILPYSNHVVRDMLELVPSYRWPLVVYEMKRTVKRDMPAFGVSGHVIEYVDGVPFLKTPSAWMVTGLMEDLQYDKRRGREALVIATVHF